MAGSNRSAISRASRMVVMHDRSAANAGCSGSMPSRTPAAAACGAMVSMPSATIARAAEISRSGAAPHTSTSTSAPSVAASSMARRLSSMRSRRSVAVAAGNIPPRQMLDTPTPASRSSCVAALTPVSASLCLQTLMNGTPCRAQLSITSGKLARSAVAWLKLSRSMAIVMRCQRRRTPCVRARPRARGRAASRQHRPGESARRGAQRSVRLPHRRASGSATGTR